MALFEVTWKSGKKETVEQSDCDTVEQFINCRFGRMFDTDEFGVKVIMKHEEVIPDLATDGEKQDTPAAAKSAPKAVPKAKK